MRKDTESEAAARRSHSSTQPGAGSEKTAGLRLTLQGTVRLAFALALAYAGVLLLMGLGQRHLQYRPDASPLQPARAQQLGFEPLSLRTPDDQRLVAWWSAPPAPTAPVLLYLHGNGANLEARIGRLRALRADGFGVMALSWRGYGGSTGEPTETGLLNDARTAWQAMSERAPQSPQLVFGESLGTAVAVLLAAEVSADGLILDSAFESALAVAQDRYPWLPVAWLLQDRYRADLAATAVRAPVLQVHCEHDPVTPWPLAQTLHHRLAQARPLLTLRGRCHVPDYARFRPAVQAFVAEITASP